MKFSGYSHSWENLYVTQFSFNFEKQDGCQRSFDILSTFQSWLILISRRLNLFFIDNRYIPFTSMHGS